MVVFFGGLCSFIVNFRNVLAQSSRVVAKVCRPSTMAVYWLVFFSKNTSKAQKAFPDTF